MPEQVESNNGPDSTTQTGEPGAQTTETQPNQEPDANRETGNDSDPKSSNGKPWAVNNKGESLGYPAETPTAEMTAEEQAAYWKHTSRKWESRANKGKDNNEEDPEADQLRQRVAELEGQLRSTDEQAQHEAVEAARTEGYETARNELLPQLRHAQLQGYATPFFRGEHASERIQNFISGINTEHFLVEGEPHLIDGEKVAKHLEALGLTRGGENETNSSSGNLYPNLGQGKGPGKKKVDWKAVGAAEAKRRAERDSPTGYQFS